MKKIENVLKEVLNVNFRTEDLSPLDWYDQQTIDEFVEFVEKNPNSYKYWDLRPVKDGDTYLYCITFEDDKVSYSLVGRSYGGSDTIELAVSYAANDWKEEVVGEADLN